MAITYEPPSRGIHKRLYVQPMLSHYRASSGLSRAKISARKLVKNTTCGERVKLETGRVFFFFFFVSVSRSSGNECNDVSSTAVSPGP